MLDPAADRILVGTAVISVIVHGAVPLWFGLATIAREVLVSLMVVAAGLAGRGPHRCVVGGQSGHIRPDVGLPGFLLAHGTAGWQEPFRGIAWVSGRSAWPWPGSPRPATCPPPVRPSGTAGRPAETQEHVA